MGREDKAKALRKFSALELEKKLGEARQESANLKFERASRDLSNPLRLREVRRVIARIMTMQREDELGSAKTGGKKK